MNDEHRNNLDQLATYVEGLPKGYAFFDMDDFVKYSSAINLQRYIDYVLNNGSVEAKCGTAACMVGHGPAAKLFMTQKESTGHFGAPNWPSYSRRVFGCNIDDLEFYWMFGMGWTDVDNTPEGGAARIRYFLKQGVPKAWTEWFRADDYIPGSLHRDAVPLYQEFVK